MTNNIDTKLNGANTPKSQTLSNLVLAEHATEIRRLGHRVKADVIEIGRRLADAKERIGHGHWLQWLNAEFGWTVETARRFIKVREFTQQDEFKYRKLLNMDLPVSALYLLAAPSAPDEARDEIAQRAEAGEKISCQTVKDTIAHSRYLQRAPRNVAQSRPTVSPTTHGAIADAAKKQPTTALNLLELWDRAPITERRRFVNSVGFHGVLAAFPENWIPMVEEWIEEQRQRPASPPMLDFAAADPGDLDIPESLRRTVAPAMSATSSDSPPASASELPEGHA